MNTDRTDNLIDAAERRLYELGLDDRQIKYALYDYWPYDYWPEEYEHLAWLIAAPREEIIDWGEYTNWGRDYA